MVNETVTLEYQAVVEWAARQPEYASFGNRVNTCPLAKYLSETFPLSAENECYEVWLNYAYIATLEEGVDEPLMKLPYWAWWFVHDIDAIEDTTRVNGRIPVQEVRRVLSSLEDIAR